MDNKKEIIPLSQTNDYSDVPSWYVLCTNGLCPFQGSCRKTIPLCAKESPATCMGRRRIMSTCVEKDHSLQNSSSGFRILSRVSATNGKFPLIDTSRLMSIIMFYHPKFKTKDFVANK